MLGVLRYMTNNIENLKELIRGTTRHGNYQQLPPCVPQEILAEFTDYKTIRLDEARFDWLASYKIFDHKSIVEIGANLGYFSLRAVSERGATSIAYEADSKLVEAINYIASLCKLDKKIEVRNEAFTINHPIELPQADVLIFQNVLHHAGFDFEQEVVPTIADWEQYAVRYLQRLTNVAPIMVFQMGYTWGGGSDRLCPSETRWHSWTMELLKQAGWNVLVCGIAVKDPKTGRRSYVEASSSHMITDKRKGMITSVGKVISPQIKNTIKPYVKRWVEKQTLEAQIDRFALRPLYIFKRS